MKKKILFLGAAPTQLPPIEYALERGYHVVTCDYLPANPGHALAHESYNISTTDLEGVTRLAASLGVDGLVAYASDPAAPTAAYVAETLGLPGNPFESVNILSRKDRFRDFLATHGFNTPRSSAFEDPLAAKAWLSELTLPVYVKPVDSSGSKGITLLKDADQLERAFDYALQYSKAKLVVVEERIHKVGYQIDSDVFLVDGKLRFWIWGNSHFNHACDPPFQMASSFPSALPQATAVKASQELEKILRLLDMKTGAFNVEFLVDAQGEIWFLEIGARNGGGRISDAIRLATGVDMTAYTVEAALGEDCSEITTAQPVGYWSDLMLHSLETGTFESIWLSDAIQPCIHDLDLWVKPGHHVEAASGSHHVIGTMLLRFENEDEMLELLDNINDHIQVMVNPSRSGEANPSDRALTPRPNRRRTAPTRRKGARKRAEG
ncbi:MAG: ATP-grasp domain-containing protein [Halomonas sp.]|nr:ATP-grasp domain-containing protein [Halomonas sp.]MCC5881604.1 ATP-grasp domain-containing protein [Halomonas sp.]